MQKDYSRFLIKRSDQTGIEPTINTGATVIDSTFVATDIMIGEMYANVEDDVLWVRTNDGIKEISLTGETQYASYDFDVFLQDTYNGMGAFSASSAQSTTYYVAKRDFVIEKIAYETQGISSTYNPNNYLSIYKNSTSNLVCFMELGVSDNTIGYSSTTISDVNINEGDILLFYPRDADNIRSEMNVIFKCKTLI
jgi:hypothetical protein